MGGRKEEAWIMSKKRSETWHLAGSSFLDRIDWSRRSVGGSVAWSDGAKRELEASAGGDTFQTLNRAVGAGRGGRDGYVD